MNKPDNCPTCFEKFNDTDKPLECGHWVHISCIQKGHKAACHICRAPLNIKVYGKLDNEMSEGRASHIPTTTSEERGEYFEEISLSCEEDNYNEEDREFLKLAYRDIKRGKYNPVLSRAIYYAERRLAKCEAPHSAMNNSYWMLTHHSQSSDDDNFSNDQYYL